MMRIWVSCLLAGAYLSASEPTLALIEAVKRGEFRQDPMRHGAERIDGDTVTCRPSRRDGT